MGYFRALVALAGLLSTGGVLAEVSVQQPLITTQATLLKGMRTGSSKQGDNFLLRTATAWQEGNCSIPAGISISGTVASLSVVPSGSGRVVWGLRLDPISCAGDDAQQMLPLLVAMQAASLANTNEMTRLETAQTEDVAITALSVPHLDKDPVINTLGHSSPIEYNIKSQPEHASPLKTGQARGLGKFSMELPDTTPVTKLVSSREIVLPQGTEFVLRFVKLPPVTRRPPKEVLAARARGVEGPTSGAKEDAELREVCVGSGCKELVAFPPGEASGGAAWTIALKGLGYQPRLNQTITSLNDDVSVHYLGSDQILLAFPLHVLIRRNALGGVSEARRIRAVLLGATDGHVLAMKEWTVGESTGPYLWSLGRDRVLANVGGELVAYGPGLEEQQHFALPGPLAYASASSAGDLILAAVVLERHSAQDHRRMVNLLGPNVPVPEDFELIGLDASLKQISTRVSHEEPTKPALLSSGIVAAEQQRSKVWNLEEVELTGSRKRLARLRSTCGIQVSSLAGGLLMVRSCEGESRGPAYRVLNANGATLLKGLAPYGDLLLQAATDAAASKFAIATCHLDAPVELRLGVQATELKNLLVTVYRTGDGKPVFTAKPPVGSAVRQTFALSPAGDRLAVLTHDALQEYVVP